MNMTLSVVAFGSSVPFVPDAVAAAVIVVVVELRGSEAVVRAGDDVTTLTLTSHYSLMRGDRRTSALT